MSDVEIDSDCLPSESSGCHSEQDEIIKMEKLKFDALENNQHSEIESSISSI
jgi:hypothetical protein